MKQVSTGRRAGRHRPRHARLAVTPARAAVCLAGLAGLALAVGFAGSGGPAGVGLAHADVPQVQAASPSTALADRDSQQRAPAAGTGVERPLGGASSSSSSSSDDAGLAPISDGFPASGLAADGIPSTALTAYQAAATREGQVTPDCGISWPLLAGIGRVESDHGRFAGATLHSDGLSTPPVIGIPLNGNGTALITDTDNGSVDGDAVYDRAVGPMQFIPSTWAGWGVDADGNGVKDPFNIFDASAAAADYLCAAGRDLTTTHGQVQAILSYNWSWDYVSMVMSLEKVYASGAVGITVPVLPTSPDPRSGRPQHKPPLPPVDPGKPVGAGSGLPGPDPSPSKQHPSSSHTKSSPASQPGSSGSSSSGSSSSSSSSSSSGTGSSSAGTPTPSDTTCASDTAPPTDSAGSSPSGCPSAAQSSSSAGGSSLLSAVADSVDPSSSALLSAVPDSVEPSSSGT